MNETDLIQKLLKIEALFAGATTSGERDSAELARQRILERLKKLLIEDPPVEYKFTFADMWSHKIFIALLRRYSLKPYRYYRQRYTTVMVQVPKRFVDETLWPEFQKINTELKTYLQEITSRIVTKVLHEDSSDAEVVEEPPRIEAMGLDQQSDPVESTDLMDLSNGDSERDATKVTQAMRKKKQRRKKKGKKKKRRR